MSENAKQDDTMWHTDRLGITRDGHLMVKSRIGKGTGSLYTYGFTAQGIIDMWEENLRLRKDNENLSAKLDRCEPDNKLRAIIKELERSAVVARQYASQAQEGSGLHDYFAGREAAIAGVVMMLRLDFNL